MKHTRGTGRSAGRGRQLVRQPADVAGVCATGSKPCVQDVLPVEPPAAWAKLSRPLDPADPLQPAPVLAGSYFRLISNKDFTRASATSTSSHGVRGGSCPPLKPCPALQAWWVGNRQSTSHPPLPALLSRERRPSLLPESRFGGAFGDMCGVVPGVLSVRVGGRRWPVPCRTH